MVRRRIPSFEVDEPVIGGLAETPESNEDNKSTSYYYGYWYWLIFIIILLFLFGGFGYGYGCSIK